MQANRNTIFVEQAKLIASDTFPGHQFVQRFEAPRCAASATAGSFVHLQCDSSIPMRRPLSIMRTNAEQGWIEVLFKIVGDGLHALGQKQPGDEVSIIGPIGRGFEPQDERPINILIGGGVGIPPMIFLAEILRTNLVAANPLVLMGSEIPFPFDTGTSNLPTAWLPENVVATMPLLESWDITCRLASNHGFDGCYPGFVTDIARRCLEVQTDEQLEKTQIFACGPTPMLEAVAKLAQEFALPCQVSLEEFMACAVGGCAGCAVPVYTEDGLAMKRVCVDGPVFEASSVFR